MNFVSKNGILKIERGAPVDGNLEITAKAAFLWPGGGYFFSTYFKSNLYAKGKKAYETYHQLNFHRYHLDPGEMSP